MGMDRLGLHALAALTALVGVHRVHLWMQLREVAARGESDFDSAWLLALRGGWREVAWVLALAGVLLAGGVVVRRVVPTQRWWLRSVGVGAGAAILALLALVDQAHVKLAFALHTGLTWSLVHEGLQGADLWTLAQEGGRFDRVAVVLPSAVFVASVALRDLAARGRTGVALTLCGAVVLGSLLAPGDLPVALAPEITDEPLAFLLRDVWARRSDDEPPRENEKIPAARPHVRAEATDDARIVPKPKETDRARAKTGLRNPDPRVEGPEFAERRLPARADHPWNVVWIVLESTGTRYTLGETFPNRPPMPFLRQLASEGWDLRGHHSPSNSSATSLFAQFSGLYPMPTLQMFSRSQEVFVPSLFTFLPATYERFLVTPGKLTYFFPQHFLRHSGLTELWGFDEVPVSKNPGGEGLSKDEPLVVGFFLDRLQRAKEPFAAVYYSYVAHWEYTDYGPAWHRYGGRRLIDRYHDNLWLLDRQILRIVEALKAQGRLERTILVLAGDHGEAFGQHARNWAHARGSWEENVQTPAVLWQPALFPPQVVTATTSHVDLLPTVLDALGLEFDERLLQGDSLYAGPPARKVHFTWGNEGAIGALHSDGRKVVVTLRPAQCAAYDLAVDPSEKRQLPCSGRFSELAELVRMHRARQVEGLQAYNAACQRKEPFEGLVHPLADKARGP
jgi:hypothetical protein